MNFNSHIESPIEIISKKIRSKDVVSMETIWDDSKARYLIIHVSRSQSYVEALPLEQFFDNPDNIEAPVLSIPFYMIKSIEKIDKSNLLFLANHMNPHISNALEVM